jgi:hypothetical protein
MTGIQVKREPIGAVYIKWDPTILKRSAIVYQKRPEVNQ